MFPVLRALRSPEVILHSLVVETRIKLHRSAPNDPIKVRLGQRHLNRVNVLHKERIEGGYRRLPPDPRHHRRLPAGDQCQEETV